MNALGGIHAAAALILLWSGAAKVAAPAATERSMRNAGLPTHRIAVQVLGLVEVTVGAAALAVPGPVPVMAVALLYVAFALFVGRVMTSGSVVGCGCFGVEEDDPPGWLHLGIVVAAAGAAIATLGDETVLADVLVDAPADGVAVAVCAVTLAGLAIAVLSVLPATRSAAATLGAGTTDQETDESIPR